MSTTFRADIRAPRFDLGSSLCRACGGRHRFAPASLGPEADPNCDACYGDGSDWQGHEEAEANESKLNGSFNVSGCNAGMIVREILGLVTGDYQYGSISPSDVLVRLASFTCVEQEAAAVAPSMSRGVYLTEDGVSDGALTLDFGRTSDQVESYLTRLKRCADLALAAGVDIVWE